MCLNKAVLELNSSLRVASSAHWALRPQGALLRHQQRPSDTCGLVPLHSTCPGAHTHSCFSQVSRRRQEDTAAQ